MTTGTLDLARVEEERRRLEDERRRLAEREALVAALDLDPAVRAHRIVEEVLAVQAAAEAGRPSVAVDDEAAVIARRIVEEVLGAEAAARLAAVGNGNGSGTAVADPPAPNAEPEPAAPEAAEPEATPAPPEPAPAPPEPTPAPPEPAFEPAPVAVDLDLTGVDLPPFPSVNLAPRPYEPRFDLDRADLVLLGSGYRLVLLPGRAFEPLPAAFLPEARPDPLPALVDDVVDSVELAPQSMAATIREAADSPGMPATRWLVMGLLWAAAFAGLAPFAAAGLSNAVQLEIDLWGDGTTEAPAVEQQAPDEPTSVGGAGTEPGS